MAPYAAATIGNTFGHNGSDPNQAAQLLSHAILGATLAYVNGGNAGSGAVAAAGSEAAAIYLTQTLYKDQATDENGVFDPNRLPEKDKEHIRNLTAAIGAVAGGIAGDSSLNAQIAGVVGQNAVENNVLSQQEYAIRAKLIKKGLGKGLLSLDWGNLNEQEARYYIYLIEKDRRTDELLARYQNNPNSLNNVEKQALAIFISQAANGDVATANRLLNTPLAIGSVGTYSKAEVDTVLNKAYRTLSRYDSFDYKAAVAAQPALYLLQGPVGFGIKAASAFAGGYSIGSGATDIAHGQYTEGVVKVVGGTLLVAPTTIKTQPKIATPYIPPKPKPGYNPGVMSPVDGEMVFATGPVKPTTSGGKANAAVGNNLKLDLKTQQAANNMVDSLKQTGKLPSNFITKAEAIQLGWKPGRTIPNGKTIGGEPYLNNQNLLPSAPNRKWYEADINYQGTKSRGTERLFYSTDGLLYFSRDHKTILPMGRWK